MSPKWITVLVVAPVAIIVLATLLIIRATYPPPKPAIASATTQPSEAATIKESSDASLSQPTLVNRVADWLKPDPPTYSISGYSWIRRNDGSSELQRGLHIQLLPATVPISAINDTLELTAKSLDKEYDRERKMAEETAKITESTPDLELANKFYGRPAAQLRANESKQTGVYRTDDAYKFVREASGSSFGIPPFTHAANATKLQEAKTDVDGKFKLEKVPDGNYFLYASINTPAVFVEWLVPVTVKGSDQSVTLDNDNMSATHGG